MQPSIKTMLEAQTNKIQDSIDAIPEQKRLAIANHERNLASLDAKKVRLKKELASIKQLTKTKGKK